MKPAERKKLQDVLGERFEITPDTRDPSKTTIWDGDAEVQYSFSKHERAKTVITQLLEREKEYGRIRGESHIQFGIRKLLNIKNIS